MDHKRSSPASGGRSFSRGTRPAQGGGRTAGGRGGKAGAYAPRTSSTGGYSRGSFTGARSPHATPAQSSGTPRSSFGGGERRSFAPRAEGVSRTGYQGHAPRPSFGGDRPLYAPRDSRGGSSTSRPYTSRSGSSSFGDRAGSRFGGGSRGGFGGARRSGGGNRGRDERIDPNRYINKAVITEEIEHFQPEHQFTDFKIVETLKKAITTKGYVNPTPIQDRSIPHVLQGVDVVGIANTGTGKTGAFLIPLINKVLVKPDESILIIVPTRELALQIDEELQGFVKGMRIFSVCAFGGANISRQIEALKSHRHFVIGTPGRLKDLIERKKLNLSKFRTVVLDEADRMLDMGFVQDMRTILALVQKERQTLFYSATLSPDIEKLIGEFLTEPVRISVKTRDTSKNIDQDVIRVPRGADKFEILLEHLKQPGFERVLVFGRTKHGVDKLEKQFNRAGVKTESIHGNKNNSKRQQALRLFKEGRVRVLVATDVAARGLDIANVSHVINFDVPATYDDYVHRIGRTGRAEKKGVALTMIEG